MKKSIVGVISGLSLFFLVGCGNAEAEKKIAEEKEVARQDSIAKELQKSQDEVKAQTEDLKNALNDLGE